MFIGVTNDSRARSKFNVRGTNGIGGESVKTIITFSFVIVTPVSDYLVEKC